LRKAKIGLTLGAVAHSRTKPEPGVAAVLSFVIPGLGQFYNGKFWRGIFWLVVTPGLWLGSGGTLGWICHVVSAYTAYDYARKL
jgi:TM2 domain-containing membrane protein YozV